MYEILRTEEFIEWFRDLDIQAATDIAVVLKVLAEFGHLLGRPYVDTLKGSKLKNLKELRVRSLARPFRILFVFDPKRRAVLLIGGNKAEKKDFYEKMIRKAEKIYDEYLLED